MLAAGCRVYDHDLIGTAAGVERDAGSAAEGGGAGAAGHEAYIDEPAGGQAGSAGSGGVTAAAAAGSSGSAADSGAAGSSAAGSGGQAGSVEAAAGNGAAGAAAGSGGSEAGSGGRAGSGGSAAGSGGSSSSVSCPEPGGAVWSNNGHCYFPLSAQNSWSVSRDNCGAAGAHLVSITSAEEQAFVATLASGSASWIGLAKFGAPSFSWNDGETFSYTHWSSGEPNQSGEAAVALRDDTQAWFDDAVSATHPALCERE